MKTIFIIISLLATILSQEINNKNFAINKLIKNKWCMSYSWNCLEEGKNSNAQAVFHEGGTGTAHDYMSYDHMCEEEFLNQSQYEFVWEYTNRLNCD